MKKAVLSLSVVALVAASLGAATANLAVVADVAEQGNSAAVLALVKKGRGRQPAAG